ncbi:MAG: hypothetical protein ABEJ24_02000 [Candidatus Magasanikbacteria bacterium]
MKYQDFRNKIENPIFTLQELKIKGLNISSVQLSRWKKRNYINTLKQGVYYFTDQKEAISREEISFTIYQPSYISLRYALHHYNLIPDVVHGITAITTKKTNEFRNDFGYFSYKHIKPELFFGYTVRSNGSRKYLLAEPEKALLDYFYLHSSDLETKDQIEQLRINEEVLASVIDQDKLKQYTDCFQVDKVRNSLQLLPDVNF